VEAGHLVQRGRRAVVVDLDAVEQGQIRAAGANARQLALERLERALHAIFAVLQNVIDHGHTSAKRVDLSCWMMVPIGRPCTTDLMLPAWCRSNTTIGRLLSRHRANAVESMTLRSFLSASSKVTRSYSRAPGSFSGSRS